MFNIKFKQIKIKKRNDTIIEELCDGVTVIFSLRTYFYLNKHNMFHLLHGYNSHNTLQHIYAFKTAKLWVGIGKNHPKGNFDGVTWRCDAYEL